MSPYQGLLREWWRSGLMRMSDRKGISYDSWLTWFGPFVYFSIYWEQSSQLTFIFFRWVGQPPTISYRNETRSKHQLSNEPTQHMSFEFLPAQPTDARRSIYIHDPLPKNNMIPPIYAGGYDIYIYIHIYVYIYIYIICIYIYICLHSHQL